MKTIEQIALEVANTSFVDRRNNIMPTSTFMGNDDELLTFTKRLIEAWLEQQSQEPVAWMGRDGEDFSYKESSYFTQPLFLAPQLVIPEGYMLAPKEPTEAMSEVLRNEHCVYQTEQELYNALLAAAQGGKE